MKKSTLKKLDKEDLIELLVDLSKLKKENDVFLKNKLHSDHHKMFKFYSQKINKAFCCFELKSLKDAREALLDFKKSKPPDNLFVDLCLYYIKCAYKLEKTDWRFQEDFYSAIENVYDMIFNLVKKNNFLKKEYKSEIKKLIKQSNEGWGHRDYLEGKFEKLK
jgi:hypothetical protein